MGYETVSSHLTASPLANGNKRIIAGVVAAVAAALAPVANAEIELGEGLGVTGFVDMSFLSTDIDGAEGGTASNFGVDQAEIDFLYSGSDGISAEVDIEFGGTSTTPETIVEQAFITKKFNDQFSIKAGRFLSYSGWETEEPTGLFQYSGVGYAPFFYGYYQQGISAAYTGEKFALMGSVVSSAFDPYEGDTDNLGYELGVAVMPIEGLTAKLFYISDEKSDTDIVNFWASYSAGGFTFAGEYNDGDYSASGKGDGYLLMGNYASGNWGITLRYHDWDIENGAGTSVSKQTGFTLSPSYKVGKNLLLVAEYRTDDVKAGGADVDSIALEALFTF